MLTIPSLSEHCVYDDPLQQVTVVACKACMCLEGKMGQQDKLAPEFVHAV